MKILFVHQNMPGQYREMIQWLAAQKEHQLVFLTQRHPAPQFEGLKTVQYRPHQRAAEDAYGLSKVWEDATGSGFGAAMAARKLEREEGFKPDIILGHTGWGELLFMKDIWPDVPVLGFFEYYYLNEGGPVGFDPEDPPSEHSRFLLRARNAVPNANLDAVDLGTVPTRWQMESFPKRFHDHFYCCHDGIRTDLLKPNPDVSLSLGRLDRPITRDDEVLTFMARNLERTRGFHVFMRALPEILDARPDARVLVIGGNGTSYGKASTHKGGLRGEMEEELGHRVDWSRVHFLGQVPYEAYQQVIQISRCHLYLTMPFVLSWSCLEAMAMGATMVATDVAPVREAITHGETGLLVDFFDPHTLAKQVVEVLARPGDYAHLGPNARAHVVEHYDFLTRCLPEHLTRMNGLVPSAAQIKLP
ncbi:glycosyltransferase [Epibacterium sp. SM1979]|uniref:Glycosyltransferase n=1 Tax=Tritonibacter litoralis TaxID=2662264 RepID=A0A843YK52_9RHOB|nr:glycosyltransferase family 4 protein [Tritonibacter litoralis]MQQ09549.1 glycosyltransferase [Tritonibacter litoralis]